MLFSRDFLYTTAIIALCGSLAKTVVYAEDLKKWKESIENGTNKTRFFFEQNTLNDEWHRYSFNYAFNMSQRVISILILIILLATY